MVNHSLNSQHLFLTVLEADTSKIKVQAASMSGEDLAERQREYWVLFILCIYLLATPWGLWDPSSSTRDEPMPSAS